MSGSDTGMHERHPPAGNRMGVRWGRPLAILGALVLLALFFFIYQRTQAHNPDPPRIAFIYRYNGTAAVAAISLDGRGRENLVVSAPPGLQFTAVLNIFSPAQQTALRPYFYADSISGLAWLAGESAIGFFTRSVGGDCEWIRIVRIDPEENRQLACLPPGMSEQTFDWSPDGGMYAISTRTGDTSRLALTASDGRPLSELFLVEQVRGLAWSADSSRLAVTLGGTHGLRIYDRAGGQTVDLQPGLQAVSRPAWSPDGRELAFFCSGSPESLDICVIGVDGSDLRRFSMAGGFPFIKKQLTWSPAGDWIAFSGVMPGGFNDILLIDPVTGTVRQLTTDPLGDTDPAWSPDGEWIVFSSNRDGNWELYRIRADGSGLKRLTETPGDEVEPVVGGD